LFTAETKITQKLSLEALNQWKPLQQRNILNKNKPFSGR